ncbi:MAG TPA: M67 family metallopeptidase [Candidatus Eisenbacteria bacterium]|nr:M67 family metallopeptidase [Candidatus Eisenbacteria bacterium]
MRLELSRDQLAQIHAALERAYPDEGCGVLLGRGDGARQVAEVMAFENTREDSRANRYLIAPGQVLEAERRARAQALDVVAFFHSHPDHPARPSAFDLEHAWPWYDYVIVGVVRGRAEATTAWRLRDDRAAFDEVEVAIVAPHAARAAADPAAEE